MDSNSPFIQAKVTKVDNSLSDLLKEISKCTAYLERLKEESEMMVGKLNGISIPALYLHEFVGVNSFLLKYISLLTEINCKFEVMEILESGNGISKGNKNYLNNVYQVFKQPIKTELNSSLDDSLEFLENFEGCNSNLNNNDKQRLQTNVVEAGKGLTDEKSTDGLSQKSNPDFSDVVQLQPHGKCPDGISNQVGFIPKEEESDPAQKKSNFEKNGFGVSSNLTARVIDEIKRVKMPSRGFEKTEPAVGEASSDSGIQIDRIKKIQAAGVGDGDKMTECVEGVTHISEIRPLEIPKSMGKEFYVKVQHIVSPSEFYVHFADRKLNLLPELEKQINSVTKEDWKEVKSTKAQLCEKIGSYALYFSEVDKMRYRVKVADWHLDLKDDLVSIFLLDYGESKLVRFENLQPMLPHLTKYPACAQRCHLSGLSPLDAIDSGVFIWDAKAKKEMISALDKAERIKIVIAPIDNDRHHPPTSFPVLLWTSNGHYECVNKLLVEKKCAKVLNVSDGTSRGKVCDGSKLNDIICDDVLEDEEEEEEEELLEKWNPMKEDYESYLNSYELDINHPAATIYGYISKDAKRICPTYARTGKCFKGNTCQKQHRLLDPSGYTTDKEEVYKSAFNPLIPPTVNSIIRVLVTSVANVNHFYCIAHHQVENSKDSLYTLVEYINEKANVREMRKLLIPPSIGQVVLAKYSQDDCWYRAKVLESEPENDLFSLIFVDYGNKETVPLSRIRAIEPKYLHLPFQGMQCFIYGVGKNPEASLDEVMKYMSEKILDQDLKIEVISQFPGDDVSLLVKVFDQKGTDIGKDLITHKYGIEKEDIILSNDSLRIPG